MIDLIRPELAVALLTVLGVILLAVIAMITAEPHGRHHQLPARTRGDGTAPHPALSGAVPLDLYPRRDGHVRVEDGDVTVRPAWVTYIPGEHPYPEQWDNSTDSTRRLYDALRELPEARP